MVKNKIPDGRKGGTPFSHLVADIFYAHRRRPHLLITLLRKHWPALLGAELASRTCPARIVDKTLWVNASDASWVYQLQFMQREMLESVQVFLENREIQTIRFQQGPLLDQGTPPQKKNPVRPKAAGRAGSIAAQLRKRTSKNHPRGKSPAKRGTPQEG